MTSKTRVVTDFFDENGFLLDPDLWDRDMSLAIAAQLKLGELEEDHWAVIDFLRAHYLDHGTLPWQSHVCRTLELDEDCIQRLFGGPVEAWKVAGLPDPGEEARTYTANQER
ncbi:MAG: TusE/DsrC/DsvC family sulfur relay protein [Chromatiaceae bacterium]|jgi:dissimilatory sulfite reductase related protein